MLAIIAAFKEEVDGYLSNRGFKVVTREKRLRFYESSQEPNVVVVDGALGKRRAQEATEAVVERHMPDYIVSAGFAGGTREGLQPGDLFVCNRLMAMEGAASMWGTQGTSDRPLLELDPPEWVPENGEAAQWNFEYSGCMSIPQVVSNTQMKTWIGATYPVSVIDMESFWVSEAAEAHGRPHMVVRSVFDPLEQTLPRFVGEAVSKGGTHKWMHAIRYLASNPTDTVHLLHLSQQVKATSASLGRFLARLVRRASVAH